MPKVFRVLVLSFIVCAAMAATPSAARAQAEKVYQGVVNGQTYCIWGNPLFVPGANSAGATVYTDGTCGAYDPRSLSPFVSAQVSVYPIAWYWEPAMNSWYQCAVGSERKLSNAYTAYKSVSTASCPHQRWISVWAHVAAQPTGSSSWYGGDVYGNPTWNP